MYSLLLKASHGQVRIVCSRDKTCPWFCYLEEWTQTVIIQNKVKEVMQKIKNESQSRV